MEADDIGLHELHPWRGCTSRSLEERWHHLLETPFEGDGLVIAGLEREGDGVERVVDAVAHRPGTASESRTFDSWRLPRTAHCSVPRDTPAQASSTSRVGVLADPESHLE